MPLVAKRIPGVDPLICFKKSTLMKSGVTLVLVSILIIFIYHKYQKSKCENFCIYSENFNNVKNKDKEHSHGHNSHTHKDIWTHNHP
jgi:hypothetical protein